MKYDIKTLVYIPQLQELTNDLYLANSIPSSIVSIDGEILTGSGWQRICMDFHRRHPVTNRECIKSGTILRKAADENTPFTIYECPHGLVDASAPIFIDGEHVANILSGQVFLTPPTPAQADAFRQRARRLGFDEKEYMAAFREVPIVEEAKFKSNLSFLKKLAGFIAESGFTQSRFLEEVREHKKAERTYRDLVENLNDAIYQVDEKGIVKYLSPQFKNISGHFNSELLGADFLQLVHPDELDKLRRDFNDALQGKQAPGEYRIKNSNGEYRWVRNSSSPILEGEKAVGIQGILSDITDRKRVTNELIKSEQALRTIFNNTHDAIFIHDLDGRILDVNQKTLEMYQVTSEQVIGMYIAGDFSSPDNPMDKLHGYWEMALAGKTLTFEWIAKRPNDDSVFEVDVALKRIILDEREVILANVRDITLRKAHERILKESEEKFRALVENSKDAIMRFDRKHRHLYVNPMAEEQNGIPLPEWIGKTHQELGFPKSLCNIWEAAIEEVFQTGLVHRKEFQLPNGQWIDWMLMPEKDTEGKVKAYNHFRPRYHRTHIGRKKVVGKRREAGAVQENGIPGPAGGRRGA